MFIACGLSHKTAPLDVREKIAFTTSMQKILLHDLMQSSSINEIAILCTCNRTEIYCDTKEPHKITDWLVTQQYLPNTQLTPFIYMHHGKQGVRHILRVASGLDSMMIGESQIFAQMKQAYQQACELGTIKSSLHMIFQYTFSASKRIRQQSGIGNNPVSLAYVVISLITKVFADFSKLKILIIGSGEISTLVAKYLYAEGVRHFLIASRNSEHAKQLATLLNGQTLNISDITHYLAEADVVISATTCPLPFISKNIVKHALSNRQAHHNLCLFDLALPRDIESDVAELAGVYLYNIDDLQHIITKGMHERHKAALKAEQLIDCELDNFVRQYRSLSAKNIIKNYRQNMYKLAQEELQRAKNKLSAGKMQDIVLNEFCERLINKLIHQPSIGFRKAAWDDRTDLYELIKYLFDITIIPQPIYEEIS